MDSGEHAAGIGGPDWGLRVIVVLGEGAVYGGLPCDINLKTASLSRLRVRAEKRFSTAFSQEALVGVRWNTQRGLRAGQARTLGVFVGGVLVGDGVDDLAGGSLGFDVAPKRRTPDTRGAAGIARSPIRRVRSARRTGWT